MSIPASLSTRIIIGLAVGAGCGLVANLLWADAPQLSWTVSTFIEPAGKLYLRLLLVLVLPLVVCSLALGIQGLGDVRTLGRLGLRCLAWSVGLSFVAVLLGVLLVNLIGPGRGVDPASLVAGNASAISPPTVSASEFIVNLVPSNIIKAMAENDLLAVLVATALFGVGLLITRTPAVATLTGVLQGMLDVCQRLLGIVLALAPVGVACLLFAATAKLGLPLLGKLSLYVLVVVAGLALHLVVVYGALVRFVGRRSPVAAFVAARPALVTAFATASSVATLPTSLQVAEERLRLPPQVARFVLTIGASANQHGTALFEGVAVLFLAQLYGIDLTVVQQITVAGICVLAGIGTAGVPAGSLPVVAMMLAMVGVPAEGIGLIIGIDRLLDMCRTTLNVAGDLALATALSGPEAPAPSPTAAPA